MTPGGAEGMTTAQAGTVRALCESRSTSRSSCTISATTSRGTVSSPSVRARSKRTSLFRMLGAILLRSYSSKRGFAPGPQPIPELMCGSINMRR